MQDVNCGKLGNLGSSIQKEQASQVPTCLVITSSESASSVDTQFRALVAEISKSVKAIDVNLDHKKCATMKTTIELIQTVLRGRFGMTVTSDIDYRGTDGNKISDEFRLRVPEASESSDSNDDEEDGDGNEKMDVDAGENLRYSSNFVSSMKEPSYCIESSQRPSDVHNHNNPLESSLMINQHIDERKSAMTANGRTQGQALSQPLA